MNALFELRTLVGLAANNDGDEFDRRRLKASFGYGFAVFEDRYTTIPELGLRLSQDDREVSLGWRLARPVPFGKAFEKASRVGGAEPEHEIGIGLGWRLDDLGGGNLGVEARRRRGPGADRWLAVGPATGRGRLAASGASVVGENARL